jgi:hypothetical protein
MPTTRADFFPSLDRMDDWRYESLKGRIEELEKANRDLDWALVLGDDRRRMGGDRCGHRAGGAGPQQLRKVAGERSAAGEAEAEGFVDGVDSLLGDLGGGGELGPAGDGGGDLVGDPAGGASFEARD